MSSNESTKDNKSTTESKSEEDINDFVDRIRTSLDMWTAFLAKYELLDKNRLPKPLNNQKIKKAIDIVDIMDFSRDERDAYEARLKWLRAENSILEKKFVQGKMEGREERNVEIAKSMLDEKIDIDMISKFTSLSLAEIKKLQK